VPKPDPHDRLQLTLTRDEARLLLGNALLPARERFDALKAPDTVALLEWLIDEFRRWLDMPPGYSEKPR
jgi:hypothetical protein